MKHIFKIIAVTILVIAMSGTVAFGADAHYRFLHNDHDTLVIGEITEIDDDKIVIRAADFVVSSQDLNANAVRSQLRPETVVVNHRNMTSVFGVGDFVIASLNSDGENFVVAWGIYGVSSLDPQTLEVFATDVFSSAKLTDFVNSGGRFTNFSIDGSLGRVIRHYGDADIVIYDENPPGIQARMPGLYDYDYDDVEPVYWDMGENPDGEDIMPIMADLGDEVADIEAIRENLPAENNNNLMVIIAIVLAIAAAIAGLYAIKKSKKGEKTKEIRYTS